MGMIIVSGRNNGYPFAEGLPETPPLAPSAPYPEFFMRVNNGGYPVIVQVPALPVEMFSPPYPEFMLCCLGKQFNSGYPLIMQLHGIVCEPFSELCFADDDIGDVFYGSVHVTAAYCNGQKVFGTRYTSEG